MGFTHETTPGKATFHYLLKRLDIAAFKGALARWPQRRLQSGWKAMAIDGRTVRVALSDAITIPRDGSLSVTLKA